MTTYGKILSLKDYEEMSKVWLPKPGGQEMFLVRIPDNLTSLTFETYQELSKLRLMWMIQEWLKYHPDKQELEQMLRTTLKQLNPVQECPSQLEFDGEEKPIWSWAMDWADSLLEFDSTWTEWFQVTNPEIEFPVDLTHYQTPESAQELHNEASIEGFLTELRTPFY